MIFQAALLLKEGSAFSQKSSVKSGVGGFFQTSYPSYQSGEEMGECKPDVIPSGVRIFHAVGGPPAIKRPWTKFQISFPRQVLMLFLYTPLIHLKFGIRVITTFRKRRFFVNGVFSFSCVFSPSHSYPTGFPYFPRRCAANCEESKEEARKKEGEPSSSSRL